MTCLVRFESAAAIAASLILSTGCSSSSAASASVSERAEQAPVQNVSTARVATKSVPTYLSLTGQLKSGRDTDLAANAAGRVTSTKVERGASVKAGTVIATLDVRAAMLAAAEAKAHAETAAASAANADTECERTRALVAAGALSKAELDRADVQCKTSLYAVSAAKARSSLAAQNVGDGVIRAPFDGVITERYVDVGEYVRHDTRVVTLVDPSVLRLEITVPETNISAVRAGANVTFSVAGYPEKSFSGELEFVGAAVRSSTRDVVVEATIAQGEGTELLRPGMFAAVRLVAGDATLPVVPKTAITTRDGKPSAFVVVNGRLEQRIVQIGDVIEDQIVVLRGLAEGESLVVAPNDSLRNGTKVSGG